ncbi:MAG: class II aldolase/adducin family protein [Minwuia sp.]|nr:class II aldolase/adducin family protein [Minwuia sp.]
MADGTRPVSSVRANCSDAEWDARLALAATYRIFDHLGWVELIFNHITLRVPGPEHHILINPYGLWYREVTASNLVKIDLDGNIIGDSEWGINPAGYVIHSAVHAAREDACCVMHTHTTTAIAVSCQAEGVSPDNFYGAMIGDRIAYHDFEGITCDLSERDRLVANLGNKNLMMLRNHGLLACGATPAAAFQRLWTLQRACDVQIMAQQGGRPLIPLAPEVIARSQHVMDNLEGDGRNSEERVFDALVRDVDRVDPSWRD